MAGFLEFVLVQILHNVSLYSAFVGYIFLGLSKSLKHKVGLYRITNMTSSGKVSSLVVLCKTVREHMIPIESDHNGDAIPVDSFPESHSTV